MQLISWPRFGRDFLVSMLARLSFSLRLSLTAAQSGREGEEEEKKETRLVMNEGTEFLKRKKRIFLLVKGAD